MKRMTFYPGAKTEQELQDLKALGVSYSTAIEAACQQGITLKKLLQDWKTTFSPEGGK